MTLSEDIASVSDAKFIDAKTGATLSGGAVSVSVEPTNAKVVKVSYTMDPWWIGKHLYLRFSAGDKS